MSPSSQSSQSVNQTVPTAHVPTEGLVSPDRFPVRRALVSVYDKTGLVPLARALADAGVEIVSTGSTAATIAAAGLAVTPVEEVTGFPECLEGRVKTLHPAVHAGILADRRKPDHLDQLGTLGVTPIDLVIVNLYPFTDTVASGAPFDACVEQIDIGGPTMLRAAAKNHPAVAVVTSPERYDDVAAAVRDQVDRLTHTSFAVTRYESYVAVAERLNALTPGDFPKRTALFNSGAEAVENAVKLARRYTGRQAVVCFDHAFHGRTALTMGLTAKAAPYKAGFGPFPSEIYRVPGSYPFRDGLDGPEAAARTIARIEAQIGAGQVACLIIEPIQGEGGFIVPAPGFLRALQEWCTASGAVGACRASRRRINQRSMPSRKESSRSRLAPASLIARSPPGRYTCVARLNGPVS